MTEDKNKHSQANQPSDGIDFEEAQNMTVGEAVRKEAEVKAGITDQDGVLDRYIKQHRDEVSAEKFESKVSDLEQLDTKALDDFIEKKRQELDEIAQLEAKADQELDLDTVDVTPEKEPAHQVADPAPLLSEESDKLDTVEPFVEDDSKERRTRRLVYGGLIAFVLGILSFVLLWFGSQQETKTTSSASSSSKTTKTSTSTSTNAKAKELNESFNNQYGAFFTDDKQTDLKNSEFSKLADLKATLDKLKDTDYYEEAKKKYDALSAQIEAIQSVNSQFESDVIVDGQKVDATVKSDANFDNLASKTLNTGNASLDKLIQSAISDGRNQLSAQATSSQSEASASSNQDNNTAQASTQSSPQASEQANTQEVNTAPATAVTGYGITNYNPASLQRNLSRVPYNESAIADSSNAAWTFNPGVLEKILDTSRQRGYITGNEFILERVNIINGNGYYNLFKPDGTYLFSLNDKTGYFVGNAPGHSDALDY
ncbi:cell division site-positioning protein MapZ family protein [Streptococcus sp. zg-JUN1979]|uniref:cell division site-positioning protein MapZ family protein n=1 Tax=Streptococcus sp. zg-JUN1979 TaxID=3391450 RepID=UPI0039A437A5